jgi:hypothetical protein
MFQFTSFYHTFTEAARYIQSKGLNNGIESGSILCAITFTCKYIKQCQKGAYS